MSFHLPKTSPTLTFAPHPVPFSIQTALNLSIMSQCDQNSSDMRRAALTIESEISVKLFFSSTDPFDPYPIGTTSHSR